MSDHTRVLLELGGALPAIPIAMCKTDYGGGGGGGKNVPKIDYVICERPLIEMMINHSTLDCHVTF